jgi:hypothetical protein
MLASLAAAAEERLKRLRSELDHAVALDPARPAAFEVTILRREHAEAAHQIGRRDGLPRRSRRPAHRAPVL